MEEFGSIWEIIGVCGIAGLAFGRLRYLRPLEAYEGEPYWWIFATVMLALVATSWGSSNSWSGFLFYLLMPLGGFQFGKMISWTILSVINFK